MPNGQLWSDERGLPPPGLREPRPDFPPEFPPDLPFEPPPDRRELLRFPPDLRGPPRPLPDLGGPPRPPPPLRRPLGRGLRLMTGIVMSANRS